MPKSDDDAEMRAELARMELEQIEVDDEGKILDKPYEAHRMRVAGASLKQIARRLGYHDEAGASRAISHYLQGAALLMSNQRKEEALHLSLTRLETLMHQHWDSALLGDPQSAGVVLKCISEMNKILGLYEVKEQNTVEKFVVIQRDSVAYTDKLREIALKNTKEITPASQEPEVLDPLSGRNDIMGAKDE